MLFVDSNIWCYYFDASSKEHKKVSEYLGAILNKEEIVMNNLVIMEIAHYLIKHLGPIRGKEKVESILQFPFLIADFDYELLLLSLDMLSKYSHTGIGGRDATILATMKKLGVKRLLTHDAAFKKVDFIDVADPLAA